MKNVAGFYKNTKLTAIAVGLIFIRSKSEDFAQRVNGKVDPQFSSIEKIANALGVSIADIVNSDNVFLILILSINR